MKQAWLKFAASCPVHSAVQLAQLCLTSSTMTDVDPDSCSFADDSEGVGAKQNTQAPEGVAGTGATTKANTSPAPTKPTKPGKSTGGEPSTVAAETSVVARRGPARV